MAKDRFLIAPYDTNSGLQTDVKPWLIPEEAFSELSNAYVFRGRVRKRFGSRWLADDKLGTRLRIQVGVTAAGALAGNVRVINADAGMPTAVGQAFSVLGIFFTVVNPAAGPQQMLRSDGLAAPATYDLATSAFNITGTGAPNGTPVFFYPAFPVMGLLNFEQTNINNEFIIGFDTRYAYQYSSAAPVGWTRLNLETTPGAAVWTGSNSQFFWGDTWTGANASDKIFFVTNFNENEPNFLRTFNVVANQWDNFRPQIDAIPNFLNAARLVVVFKNRLIFLNTWEGPAAPLPGTHYPNRARYSQIGSPLDVNAFRQDIPGRGNAIDCPTTEAIITCEFIKDRLIVYFERSTWELVYTGNQAYPFAWQQINTELGAESTFSIVPFDKVALGVGNVGIHACNGANVERIDNKIPDTVFAIHNADEGVQRVYGIRDYFVEMVYWTFPDVDSNSDFPFPNRVLIYNYKNSTWAFNDDSITVFGYFNQPPAVGVTWDSTIVTWDDVDSWDSGALKIQFRQVLGGNQEGYTFIVDPDETTNAAVIQITNIAIAAGNVLTITAINHNLRNGDFIYIQDVTGTGNLNLLNNQIYEVIDASLPDSFTIVYDKTPVIIAGVYNGAGVFARVSQISITTKEYNFYAKQGRNNYVSKVDFMVDTTGLTAQCSLDVNFFVSTSTVPLLQDGIGNNSMIGVGTLDTFPYASIPFENNTARVIHPVYIQADGEFVQLQITMNNQQMTTVVPNGDGTFTGPTFVDFQMHFMMIYAQPTTARFQ